jgi:hypothetical protein
MIKKDPFVIPVPPGATEIDLRPYLLPLIKGLICNRWDPFNEPVSAERVEGVMAWWRKADEWWLRAEGIDIEWVKAYLLDHGWVDEMRWSPENLTYKKPMKGCPSHWLESDRWHRIRLKGMKHLDTIMKAIHKIMEDEGIGNDGIHDLMDKIIAYAPPLEQLANEGRKTDA